MAQEAFSITAAQTWFWTGTATASANQMFANNVFGTFMWGYRNTPLLSGYCDTLAGKRADFSFGALLANESKIRDIVHAETAVHIHVQHSAAGPGSAGYYLYSARVDSLQYAGDEFTPFRYSLAVHANSWSAY